MVGLETYAHEHEDWQRQVDAEVTPIRVEFAVRVRHQRTVLVQIFQRGKTSQLIEVLAQAIASLSHTNLREHRARGM